MTPVNDRDRLRRFYRFLHVHVFLRDRVFHPLAPLVCNARFSRI